MEGNRDLTMPALIMIYCRIDFPDKITKTDEQS